VETSRSRAWPGDAQSIVDFRDQHGGVSSVDQLDQIDGIGLATMDAPRRYSRREAAVASPV
jgi:hypothetical protein